MNLPYTYETKNINIAKIELVEYMKELEFTYNPNEDFVSFIFNKIGEYKVELKFTDLAGNEYIKEPKFIIYGFKSNQISYKT